MQKVTKDIMQCNTETLEGALNTLIGESSVEEMRQVVD